MNSVGLKTDPAIQSHSGTISPRSPWRQTAIFSAALFLLTAALYYPVRTHPFVNYDDNLYVTENQHVKDGLTWDTVTWAFVTYDAGNWHPTTWLSHALDVELYGIDPVGHHLTNVLLHAANAALLFWVLLSATSCAGRSLIVAALFAVHPLNVEPVVWIAERKTVLSMTFFLLALGAYRWYAAQPKWGRYLLVALLFALGLMSKPQVITFPFVLLLWDYWPLRRLAVRSSPFTFHQNNRGNVSAEKRTANSEERPSGEQRPGEWRWLLLEKIPLLAMAAASAVITMKAQRAGHALFSFSVLPLSIRLSNAIVSYIRYLEKCFWPVRLAPMYPHPGASLSGWEVYGAFVILLAITIFVIEKRHYRYLLVGWLWFLGTLVPMIGLVQVGHQAMADRYTYLPLLGVFIMVCWGVADWYSSKRLPAQLLPVAGVMIVLALMVVARRQIVFWADNALLWTHTIEVTPPNYIAEDNLGGILLTRNRPEEAIAHFRKAAAIHPNSISAFNIGFYEQQHGELQQAIEHYQQAIALTTRPSQQIVIFDKMGHAYGDLGDRDHARQCFDEVRKLQVP